MPTKKNIFGLSDMENNFGNLTFGDLLKLQREDNDLTQSDFAKKLGITRQKLCDFEKGRRIPSPKMAEKWAQKVGHPAKVWVQIVLQDQLRKEKVKMKVSVA